MENKYSAKETIGRKALKLIWKGLPFLVVLVIILLVVLPLSRKISAKKNELAQKQSRQKTIAKALTNVVTMELVPGMVMEKIKLPGVVKPWISLEVVSEIRGKVISKNTIEGRRVNKGDILAVIDKSDYQNSYDSALASHETALATRKRLKALAKNKFATQSQLDDAIARVKTTRAALENARLALSRCTIRSPMQGIVDKVYIENGAFLAPGDPVVKILQINRVKIEVGIPESDVADVRKLKSFEVTIDALDGKIFAGQYHYLSKTTTSMARLYNLEIEVANREGQILPGMFAKVKIIKHRDPKGLSVPMYSLVTLNKNTGVYVENNSIVSFRPVTPGFLEGWKIQIVKGLYPGEKIVVVGHRMIEDGEKVNVTKVIRDMGELSG